MLAKVAFLAALLVIILTILLARSPKKEALNLVPPAGYAAAKPVEKQTDDTFVSALEYAQAFSTPKETVKEAVVLPPPVVAKAKPAIAKGKRAKRQIAKSNLKKLPLRRSKLVARW